MSKHSSKETIIGDTNISILIPFRNMPNVSYILDFNDYRFALTYEDGLFFGFMIMIHMNEKYPQYHNLRYDETSNNHMEIFTSNGWETCLFKDIFGQLEEEALECIEYVHDNGKEMLEKIEILKKIEI